VLRAPEVFIAVMAVVPGDVRQQDVPLLLPGCVEDSVMPLYRPGIIAAENAHDSSSLLKLLNCGFI